jgi:UDP-2-acetamido-3-amino-2,3-dideoxy-glucuronate N-acetyltransferase
MPHINRELVSMPVAEDVQIGHGVRIFHPDLVNLYGCIIGAGTRIGSFVEIQIGAKVGARCKISSHTFICEGVTIEDEVFVGHGVMFTNDRFPRAATDDGRLQGPADWKLETTRVGHRASIGSNATILCGISIGAGATVGAGSVVTRDVSPGSVVAGVPARPLAAKAEIDETIDGATAEQQVPAPHSGRTSP